jgi:hypothetical protein
MVAEPNPLPTNLPTRRQALEFRLKASLLQVQRGVQNRTQQTSCRHPQIPLTTTQPPAETRCLAESVTPLWTEASPGEFSLQAGKVQNLRVALQQLHGTVIPAGGVFSFWAQLGRPSRARGYVPGREIRQGCVIPSVAGGLCQLSNALYSAALDAGFKIIERHRHTRVIPGSLAEQDRDATVFWNYVDLRFQVAQPTTIVAYLEQDRLVVRFYSQASIPAPTTAQPTLPESIPAPIGTDHECATCGVTACFRNTAQTRAMHTGQTAYLVDELWPEFDRYLQSQPTQDLLLLPLNGQQWRKANYAWSHTGFTQVKAATHLGLKRSWASRRFSPQGNAFQNLLLGYDRQFAHYWGKTLPATVTHVVTMQAYLPWLWQQGSLGGRSFDVLMTRLPLAVLQAELDTAAQAHPQSPTLDDFRTDPSLIAAEAAALKAARQIITPHRAIAALFPNKAVLLDWHLPPSQQAPSRGEQILFPAATLGRKGAYELRQAIQLLGTKQLTVLGRNFEGETFWSDLTPNLTITPANSDPLAGVKVVVLPAYVEHRPRLLLRALAAQIPVIATPACGLGEQPGVFTVPTGNAHTLANAIDKFTH